VTPNDEDRRCSHDARTNDVRRTALTESRERDHKVSALVPIALKVPPEEIRIDQEQHVRVEIYHALDVVQNFVEERLDETAVASGMV